MNLNFEYSGKSHSWETYTDYEFISEDRCTLITVSYESDTCIWSGVVRVSKTNQSDFGDDEILPKNIVNEFVKRIPESDKVYKQKGDYVVLDKFSSPAEVLELVYHAYCEAFHNEYPGEDYIYVDDKCISEDDVMSIIAQMR